MKKLIIISLFILISSKLNDIEYGKELPFENGKNFIFTNEQTGFVFINMLYDGPNKVNYKIEQSDEGSGKGFFSKPGTVLINKVTKGTIYNVTCFSDSNEKGTIWINPSWNELKVDLNKQYIWKVEYSSTFGHETNLTYAINNAEKKVTFKFTYNKGSKNLPNPFRVCHGGDCKDNVETYDFEQGQSYKIIVKIVIIKDGESDVYYFPTFKFGDIKGDWSYSFNLSSNLWIISLLLLLIL